MSRTKFVCACIATCMCMLGLLAACGEVAYSPGRPSISYPEPVAVLSVPPVLGLVMDSKAHVLFVEPQNAVQRAGIQIGDTVLSIDGFTNFREDIPGIRKSSTMKKSFVITVRRKDTGKQEDVTVSPDLPASREGQPTPTAVPQDQFYF